MKLPFEDKKFIFLLFAVSLAIVLEISSILGLEIPMPYATFIYATFILGIGYKVLWNGLISLFKLKFSSINSLMLIAVVAAFYLGEYPEATVVIVLYILGEKLEDIGIENSMSALNKLINDAPKTATIKGDSDETPVEDIPIGTSIQVKPYDLIPLDGIIELGETFIDESSITGEPIPKEKTVGESVFAGTLNQNGYVEIKTTKSANDTTFAQIIELTYNAQNNKSRAQTFIQKFAQIYTPIIIVLAVLVLVIPVFLLKQDFTHWLNQAITLLVISCPCALVISTPIAIYAAIGNASTKGILVKGGKFLESMADIKAIALDKTRTITYGSPVVSDIIPLNGNSNAELLACGAGVEIFSEHPLAQAIVNQCRKEKIEPHQVEKFESLIGKGAKAACISCGNTDVFVGKINSKQKNEEIENIISELSNQGKTNVVVNCNHEIKGIIGLIDQIKPDSREAIEELSKLNVKCIMLTGDNENAAQHIASNVGIKNIFAELLPQDKAQVMRNLLSEHTTVAMVGDGVNDTPALAEASVGIAMAAAGSDTAIEISNIALMNDKLSLIPYLIRLSQKTVQTIKRNTIGAILIKILFILLAFFGYSNLVLAIAADVGVMLIVVLISLRLTAFK